MRPLFATGLLFFFSGAIAGNTLDKNTENLRTYEKKIEGQRQRLSGLLKKEGSLLSEVDRLSSRIDRLSHESARLEKNRGEVESRLSRTSAQMSDYQKAGERLKDNVAQRLRDLYMWGRPGYLRVLLSADNWAEFRSRRWLVQRWIERDRKEMGQYQDLVRKLSVQRQALERDQTELGGVIREIKSQKSELDTERERHEEILSLVRTQKDFYRKSISDLEEAAKNLERLIETFRPAEGEGEGLFAKMRGRLILPVRGKLEKGFGPYRDEKVQTKLHHKGIDFRAREGTPVAAAFDGKVVYADWFVGYGKIMILDHGAGYFTLYAHARELLKRVGDEVSAGEPIAEVGDTGSLKGSYLYFELRHKGISQDPWPWFGHKP